MKTMPTLKIAGIIPARFASSRFPGKPLASIGGIPMIKRVYDQASKALETVYVATDDSRIYDAVKSFGGNVVMTSSEHRSGTDRCAEAVDNIGSSVDVVINIQGDEPFIKPEQVEMVAGCFSDPGVEIATLIRVVASDEDLFNPNHPKVAVAANGDALYFSRSVIPYCRQAPPEEWTRHHTYYKHLGIYGYTTVALKKITRLPHGILENTELLEQNRWLEHGFRIRTAMTPWESIGIDTPEDLERAEALLLK